jgi:hypothetical protein
LNFGRKKLVIENLTIKINFLRKFIVKIGIYTWVKEGGIIYLPFQNSFKITICAQRWQNPR